MTGNFGRVICLNSSMAIGWLCPSCSDFMYYRDSRYKCYSCSHIVLSVVRKPISHITNLSSLFRVQAQAKD